MFFHARLLGISYRDRVTNQNMMIQITTFIGPHDDLFTTMKKRKFEIFRPHASGWKSRKNNYTRHGKGRKKMWQTKKEVGRQH